MSRSDPGATVAWDVARVLIVGCVGALLVAGWFALSPVENPGVQECGPPIRFIATNEKDTFIPIGTEDSPPNAPELRTQPPCSELVVLPLQRSAMFLVVGIALGLAGAGLGLLDDRIDRRRAPRFEDLVRPRPDDAPGRALDPVPTSVDDLGEALPPIERTEVALQVGGWVVAAVALAGLADVDAVRAALARIEVGDVVSVAVLLTAARVVSGLGRWVALGDGRRPVARSPVEDLDVAVAADLEARLRPETGVAGLDVHRLVRARGLARSEARHRAAMVVALAVAVHLVAVLAAAYGGVPEVAEPDGREYVLLVGGTVMVLLVGLARLPSVLRSLAVTPIPGDLWAALRRPRAVATTGAVVAHAVGIALQVWVVDVLFGAVGVDASVRLVALVVLLGITIGAASPFGDGAGLTEAVVVLVAWRWGAPVAAATAAVIVWRLASTVAPLGAGAVSGWSLRRRGVL